MSVDTNNAEFQDALDLIQYTRQSVFLTGKAGKIYIPALCLRAYQEKACCTCTDRNCRNQCRWKYHAQLLQTTFLSVIAG